MLRLLKASSHHAQPAFCWLEQDFLQMRCVKFLSTAVFCGLQLLSVQYDLFVINLVLRLLKDEYPEYSTSGQVHVLEGSVASAALVGSILGQVRRKDSK